MIQIMINLDEILINNSMIDNFVIDITANTIKLGLR